MKPEEFREQEINDSHRINHTHDYEAMEAWPLGMFKLAMRFAKDYALAVRGEGEPHGES